MANYRQQEFMRARQVMPSDGYVPPQSYRNNMSPQSCNSNMSSKSYDDTMPIESCGNDRIPHYHRRNNVMPPENSDCKMSKKGKMYESVDKLPLAMAYIPWQEFCNTFELHKALQIGTIFPELEKPFCGKRGVK